MNESPSEGLSRKTVALLVLAGIKGYDLVIVAPVLEDWAEGRPFRTEDRHRVLILSDHLEAVKDRAEFAELIEAVRGAL